MPGLPLTSSRLSPVSEVRNSMQSRTALLMGKYNLSHKIFKQLSTSKFSALDALLMGKYSLSHKLQHQTRT